MDRRYFHTYAPVCIMCNSALKKKEIDETKTARHKEKVGTRKIWECDNIA